MRLRSALITGAAGFIGSHLVRRLVREGWAVQAMDVRSLPADLRNVRVQYHRADLRNGESLPGILHGVDTVYHLASAHLEVHAGVALFREVNVHAAATLARACAAAGVRRLVHTSSVGVYGHVLSPPAAEDAPLAPRSVYERTKLAGEQAVLSVAAETGLEVIVLRPSWVYGSGCGRTRKLMRSLSNRRFIFIGDGSNLRHPVYIEDVIDAFESSATAASTLSGRVYNIAGPRALPLGEMVGVFARALGVSAPRRHIPRAAGWVMGRSAELIWSMAGREPPFSRRSLSFFENDNSFDTSAARKDLGFVPCFDLEEGVRCTLDSMAAQYAA